jgi:molecular chaperone GrpE (heat shock protein)
MQYTAALAKEMLGLVRGKYTTIQIPGAETTLNQQDLLSQAAAEKTALLERLRADLDAVSRKAQLEQKQAESVALKATMNEIPLQIYIG